MHEGAGRGDALPAQPARRARAADRRDGRRWTTGTSTRSSPGCARRRRSPSCSRAIFEGVLDMLSGRYVSDEFAELRPRITWDRVGEQARRAREGARRVAVVNGGTIPDRGLYGVFLAGAREEDGARVGELDEEMVFEIARRRDLPPRRVDVAHRGDHPRPGARLPAPGEPGKMPFWHGDRAGRPLELGRAIGELVRELRGAARRPPLARLAKDHDLDPSAAREPAPVPRRPGRGDRRRPRRSARS